MSFTKKYKIFSGLKNEDIFTFDEYLDNCKSDKSFYANPHERMLKAIGDPVILDTSKDERLGRIHGNKKIKTYPVSFAGFHGIYPVIESIGNFHLKAAQGLEEAKQILALKGPVGTAKSSLAERMSVLFQSQPFFTIQCRNFAKETLAGDGKQVWEFSPLWESPLGLIDYEADSQEIEDLYNIQRRYMKYIMSPWALKRLSEVDGDLSQIRIVKMYPSILKQIGIAKVEPSDDNNQDVSTLIGKVSISKIGDFDQSDVDAYSFRGGLNATTQGMMEFVEMFKAPIKTLHPLLTALQDGCYNGSEAFGKLPYQGIIASHFNLTEWQTFRNDKKNEAFIDRVYPVDVPYCLSTTEEEAIYNKLIVGSELRNAPVAPGTRQMLARFAVLTRLFNPENSTKFLKMEVYDGKNIKDKHPSVKSHEEYRTAAGVKEGMEGFSTRDAFKVLSSTYNYSEEIGADPIHLMTVLEHVIKNAQYTEDKEKEYLGYIKELGTKHFEFVEKELQTAYMDNAEEFCQNTYERYVTLADHWLENNDFKDPDTNTMYDRETLNKELEKIEKPAGISNPKEFRTEIVKFHMRKQSLNKGVVPRWNSYEKMREVIEKKVFAKTDELLPVIGFNKKNSKDIEEKHDSFVQKMMVPKEDGTRYTLSMVKTTVEWYNQNKHNG